MGNVIVVGIIVVIVILAVRSSLQHFRGEGGCCGGGSSDKTVKKKLDGAKIGEYIIRIEGMHCDNCKMRVENAINKIDGVSAKISLKKKQAVIAYDRIVEKEEIFAAIRRVGYEPQEL